MMKLSVMKTNLRISVQNVSFKPSLLYATIPSSTALAQLPELSALAVICTLFNNWMERLSLSTDEAHQRVQDGLDNLWRTAELFELSADEKHFAEGLIPDFQMKRTMEPNHCR